MRDNLLQACRPSLLDETPNRSGRDAAAPPTGRNGVTDFGGAVDRLAFPSAVPDQGSIVVKQEVRAPGAIDFAPASLQQETDHFRERIPAALDPDAEALLEDTIALG
jgi:hypothetical protein